MLTINRACMVMVINYPSMWEIIRSGSQRPCEYAIHRSNGSAGIHPMPVESFPPIATISSCPGGLQLGCAFAAPRPKLISCFYLSIYLFIYLSIHLFIYSFIHLFIYSFIHSLRAGQTDIGRGSGIRGHRDRERKK
jgi:hypothetical protein